MFRAGCGIRLYRFLIIAFVSTLHTIIKQPNSTWKSTRTITVLCTVLELGPFEHLMEETEFSERNCYLNVFK